jgi:hypothetical protein
MSTFDASPNPSRKKSPRSRKPVAIGTFSGAMPIQCQYCSGQSFRRSRLRSEDFWQMVLMRYPVRCLRCSQRQMVSFTIAGISHSSLTKHTRPVRADETWKHWTEPSDSGPHIAIQPPRRDE